ncbi:hypothetical protein NC652_027316 [Populus alba x Populus x berolinensis]|nr:hypothetical protein NC652_027316 [Populus alba x Populus x berolinensis]
MPCVGKANETDSQDRYIDEGDASWGAERLFLFQFGLLKKMNSVTGNSHFQFGMGIAIFNLVTDVLQFSNEAARAPSGFKKLAAEKVIYTFLESLYVLVRCTPDLSTSDCNQCLLVANLSLSICCNNMRGVRVLFPSCNFRFDNYSFVNEVAFDAMVARPLSTPVVLPPPSPGSRAVGEGTIYRSPDLADTICYYNIY